MTSSRQNPRQPRFVLPSPPCVLRCFLWALLCCISVPSPAQQAPPELGAVALDQALKDLGNDFRLMCVAAHPDDEDGATLAYYRMKYGARTFAVIATRGEGGQNEIGPELYEDLAVIRTREMRAAARVEGAELHFLDLPEFGFSKSIEETFEIWGHDETLRRMVALIREIRPHVIITHHGRMKDHGHHQAIGLVVQEAFDAAADAARFPEQLANLGVWQVSRLFIRNWEGAPDSVAVPLHELNPARGKTYAEIAAQALEEHKSQGMGFFIEQLLTGRAKASYDLVKSAEQAPANSVTAAAAQFGALFEGLPLAGPTVIAPGTGGTTPSALIEIARRNDLPADSAAEIQREAHTAAAIAAEIRFRVDTPGARLAPGTIVSALLALDDFGEDEVSSVLFRFAGREQLVNSREGNTYRWQTEITLPADAPPNYPPVLHLRESPAAALPPATARVTLDSGAVLDLEVSTDWEIAPPRVLRFLDGPYLLRRGDSHAVPVTVQATQYATEMARTPVIFSGSGAVLCDTREDVIEPSGKDSVAYINTRLQNVRGLTEGVYEIRVTAGEASAETEVHVVDLKIPKNIRVGVVSSYDTTLVNTLAKLGVAHTALDTPASLAGLAGLTTVLVDMRAYQYRPDLVAANHRLLEFAQDGGTVIVLYQKTFDWKPEFAPYPLRVSRNRVTREDAAVQRLLPDHPFFHEPNEITEQDWTGWIQERGLYLPDEWDAHYTPLLEMQDPGESIPPGALLVAEHGRGVYVYTALALYRQWRALHPGALRILANLLAL